MYFQSPMILLIFVSMCCAFSACSPDDQPGELSPYPSDNELLQTIEKKSPDGTSSYYILPDSDDISNFPFADEKNPITPEKIELGKMLFFETGLAQLPLKPDIAELNESYSCATCHLPEFGFTPGRIQGIGDGAIGFGEERSVYTQNYDNTEVDVQGLRPLSLLNVSFVTNTMWNGMFGSFDLNEGTSDIWDNNPFSGGTTINGEYLKGLEAQNIEGLHLHRMEINETVLIEYGYKELFDKVFGVGYVDENPDKAFSFAVSAYLRSLFANEAPFQKWLKGDSEAMTENQKLGAQLFFDKARCQNCHNQPSFGGHSFHKLGTQDMMVANSTIAIETPLTYARSLGRGGFTNLPEDNFKFKVPQLYNTGDYKSYFHGSSKSSLEEVLDFKIAAQSEHANVPQSRLSGFFSPLPDISDEEKEALLDFLDNALRDDNLNRYIPDSILSNNCFPNADYLSIAQNKCFN